MKNQNQNPVNISLQLPSTEQHQNGALTSPGSEEILKAFLDFVRDEEETEDYLQLKKEIYLLKEKQSVEDEAKKALEDEVIRLNQCVTELEEMNGKQHEMISYFQKQQEANRYVPDEEKKIIEDKVAEMEPNPVDSPPLVIKKLYKVKNLNTWHVTFATAPANLSIANSDNILFDDIAPGNELILEGVVSQYHEPKDDDYCLCDRLMVSNLLSNVLSCQLTELYLCNQSLSWKEYLKLISSRTVQNFYFSGGEVLNKKGGYNRASLYSILKKLPQVSRFAYLGIGNVTNETFKNLVKRPSFENLRIFKLDSIDYQNFNAESFLKFMMKYPNVLFILGFVREHSKNMVELNDLEQFLLSNAPANKLVIKY